MGRADRNLDKLQPRHEEFCLHYISNGNNATRAAIAAGFAERTAKQAGYRMTSDPLIQARIRELLAEKHRRLHMDADEILARIALVARADVRGIYNDDGTVKNPAELDDAAAAAVAGIEVLEEFSGTGKDRVKVGETKKVRLRDPMAALRLLAEHKKLVKTPDDAANAIVNALAERMKAVRERRRKRNKESST